MAGRYPVVTGLGLVSAAGCGVGQVWEAIQSGRSGLKPLSLFASPRHGQLLVGEIREDLASLGAPRRGSRTDKLGWLAAREAIQHSGIEPGQVGDRTGVLLGTSVGGSFDSERFLTALIKRDRMRPGPARHHECVSAVDCIAGGFGLYGPSMAVSTACSSGALAIATAAELIMSGQADVMLAGGADSLSRMTWGGFHSLLLVDAAGCRPFDAARAGMSLGEGAAILVLEAEEHAQARGARVLARLSGWAAGCDAHHVTAPHPEGAGAAATMRSALARAGLEAPVIDYVNAHGTGTRDNDLAEAAALKTVFGGQVPPFSSTKRFFGHALAASGAIEAAICIEALRRGEVPANPGFSAGDAAIGLLPVTKHQRASLTHVMSNSFGFGGNNAVLIFSQPAARVSTRSISPVAVAVTGMAVIGPGTTAMREVEPPLPAGKVLAHDCSALLDGSQLTANQRRRLSRISRMALVTARQCHAPVPGERVAVAIGTGLGCLADAGAFIENLIGKDEREPMPARFPGSVHNAPAGQVAIDLGARGMNSTPTNADITFECALWQAWSQIAAGEADCALAGAVDELNKYPLAIGKRWGLWTEATRPGEGAVVASLRRAEENSAPLARVTAVRLGRFRKPFDAAREAGWIATAVDLNSVATVVTGAKGWPALDSMYEAVVKALSARSGRTLGQQTYKQDCGEYPAASGYGFAVAVGLVRRTGRGVLLFTLSPRGYKALCLLQP